MANFHSVLVDPHYVTCLAVMCDATDMIGEPSVVYVGPAGVHWVITRPSSSLRESPALGLPWHSYVHSDVSCWWYEDRYSEFRDVRLASL